MSAQVTITQLPQASALTGAESVPIVQNGVTVQTTASAISGAGALNYPFLTVGSTAGLNGDTGTSSYGSSKAALMYLTKVMARELGQAGIRVNAVAPTITETDMFDQMNGDARDALIQGGAIRRASNPREIANVVAFLASPESSMITGQILRVDGGQRGR